MIRKVFAALFVIGALSLPSLAQDKPNLSGTWKMDAAKSNFGEIPAPASRTDVISQTDSAIKDSVDSQGDQGEQKYTLTIIPDGQEKVIPADSPDANIGFLSLQKITGSWQGNVLAVTENAKYDDSDIVIKSTYTLSSDGNVLTLVSHINASMGDIDLNVVFDKQGGAEAGNAGASASPNTAMGATPSGSMAKPNLSGTWKLNVAKSDLGEMPPPDSRIETIEDNEPAVKIDTAMTGGPMGEMKFTTNVSTDGKETTSTIMGSEAKNTAHWEGNALVVSTAAQFQDNAVQIKNTYTVSDDGKTLNIASQFSGPDGDMHQKLVFDKQP